MTLTALHRARRACNGCLNTWMNLVIGALRWFKVWAIFPYAMAVGIISLRYAHHWDSYLPVLGLVLGIFVVQFIANLGGILADNLDRKETA